MKTTMAARMVRVEYATYINTILIATHIGIPLTALIWRIFF